MQNTKDFSTCQAILANPIGKLRAIFGDLLVSSTLFSAYDPLLFVADNSWHNSCSFQGPIVRSWFSFRSITYVSPETAGVL